MKNKIIIIILGAFFIVFLALGLIGLFSKSTPETKPELPKIKENVQVINYTNEIRDIIALREKISSFEFSKSNKGFDSEYLKLTINNNDIEVEVQKSGIKNADESTPEVIKYTIKDIENPAAVKGQMSKEEGNTIHVYTLDTYGRLFLTILDADPSFHNGITTYLLDVKDIVSFASLTIPLEEGATINYNYVIFRTEDSSYYTDYKFDAEGDVKITKINNVAGGPQETEENTESEAQ